ncbi:MAG TPA: acyl-CoA thioesterase [Lacibacter sp.]|nr:acyl-CoA thioesterase [Lacibacter sp.]
MSTYVKSFELRWGDVDANQHVMHSKYYELGAHCRMSYLLDAGLSIPVMLEHNVSPILFRESCTFRRELMAGEKGEGNLLLIRCRGDASRWSVRHEIHKSDGTLSAIIEADLAWMNPVTRKLVVPPPVISAVVESIPRSDDFELPD